jgi:hypothetical protein
MMVVRCDPLAIALTASARRRIATLYTHTPSTVRPATLRERCLSFAKTCAIGFKSGKYFVRKNSLFASYADVRRTGDIVCPSFHIPMPETITSQILWGSAILFGVRRHAPRESFQIAARTATRPCEAMPLTFTRTFHASQILNYRGRCRPFDVGVKALLTRW